MDLKRFWITAAFFFGIGGTWIRAEQKPFTLQDLDSLSQRQAWTELIFHLQDIPPADRTSAWNRLAEKACLRENIESEYTDYCREELMSVLASEPSNKEFAFKAGKWARVNLMHWAAVPFFAKAGLEPKDARCQDEDVQMAVVSGLGLPKDSNLEIVSQSRRLAFTTCWPAMQDPVLKAFNDDVHVRENSCSDLKTKGVLKGLRAKMCSHS